MTNHGRVVILAMILTMVLSIGCNRVPSHVIPPDKMAKVMADMHTAEAMMEANYGNYSTDSAKMLLKQSVLARHGYTLQDLDTSFMWYGRNLKKYGEIFDREVEILQDRLSDAGMVAMGRRTGTQIGDSVNIWDHSRFVMIKPNLPGQNIIFTYPAGENWEKGDMFTLRAKITGTNGTSPTWTLQADYEDGSIELLNNRFSNDGWHSMTLYADSTKTPKNIYGSMAFNITEGAVMVDSIELIRKSLMPENYGQRYRQRSVDIKGIKKPLETDNTSQTPTDSTSTTTTPPTGTNRTAPRVDGPRLIPQEAM